MKCSWQINIWELQGVESITSRVSLHIMFGGEDKFKISKINLRKLTHCKKIQINQENGETSTIHTNPIIHTKCYPKKWDKK